MALGLDRDNFVLLGHSWGGILATEYALAPQHLKGLVISNMMASFPAYNPYAHDVLMPPIDQAVLAEIQRLEAAGDYRRTRATRSCSMEQHYIEHVLRMPLDEWPDPVSAASATSTRRSTCRCRDPANWACRRHPGDWDRSADLEQIDVPTLVIGAQPRHHGPRPHGLDGRRYRAAATCSAPTAATWRMYDDQATYVAGLVEFLVSLR